VIVKREQARKRMRRYRAENSQEPKDDQPVLGVLENTSPGSHTERELYDLDQVLAFLPPIKAAWLRRQLTRLEPISHE
jgi:hypothetical protein